ILNKPGPLTGDEYEVMKAHTIHAQQMLGLSDREIMKAATIIALQHHEKYDGTGYPRGLKGEQIHLYARITAIADVFDALCNDRSYRHAWTIEDIVAMFRKERGAHFDPALVDLFLGHFALFVEIKNAFANHAGRPAAA
ncbi:MAG TPA: HD domain-containing phosphohydrolase, partial [Desulfurivibrionaceae bacterium]|nr:HD domain-containing phosphohydrolase [Desulfurivibrionaceae bacterium]